MDRPLRLARRLPMNVPPHGEIVNLSSVRDSGAELGLTPHCTERRL
jgi:hypothetical protein